MVLFLIGLCLVSLVLSVFLLDSHSFGDVLRGWVPGSRMSGDNPGALQNRFLCLVAALERKRVYGAAFTLRLSRLDRRVAVGAKAQGRARMVQTAKAKTGGRVMRGLSVLVLVCELATLVHEWTGLPKFVSGVLVWCSLLGVALLVELLFFS
jgi:hypothetical protein